jgi:hypothetical protein
VIPSLKCSTREHPTGSSLLACVTTGRERCALPAPHACCGLVDLIRDTRVSDSTVSQLGSPYGLNCSKAAGAWPELGEPCSRREHNIQEILPSRRSIQMLQRSIVMDFIS